MMKLKDVLYLNEKKKQAMDLIRMIEMGALPTPRENGLQQISKMEVDDFIENLSFAANSLRLKEKRGAFSAALIDFGNGPVECVIKVQVADPNIDQGMKYLKYCMDHGGRKYCTAFPDVYWMGTARLKDNKKVQIAVIEFVNLETSSRHEGFLGMLLASFEKSSYKQIIDLNMRGEVYGFKKPERDSIEHNLAVYKWNSTDLAKFIESLRDVGGTIDVHAGNFGFREDGSLCVFDPLSYNL